MEGYYCTKMSVQLCMYGLYNIVYDTKIVLRLKLKSPRKLQTFSEIPQKNIFKSLNNNIIVYFACTEIVTDKAKDLWTQRLRRLYKTIVNKLQLGISEVELKNKID